MSIDAGSVPTGYSAASAIQQVLNYSNEISYPGNTILLYLNKGLEQVVREIGGIRLWKPYYTVANQTFVALDNDVQYVISANFSMGSSTSNTPSPLAQGSLVYPMMALEQAGFMDAAAGFPAVGFGPPQAYFVFSDQGQSPNNTLPAPGSGPSTAYPMPSQPNLSAVTGTSTGTIQWIKITYTNANGETTPSSAASFTPTSVQQTQVASPPAYANANGYNTYASATQNGTYYLQNTTGATAIGSPYTVPGTLVATGTQAPSTNTATGNQTGGALTMQLYPAAIIGSVNVYYMARPLLWNDSTSSAWTNLDTSAQEAAVIWATIRVLQARQRQVEVKEIWRPEYDNIIQSLKETQMRRTVPRSGQVRDVANRSYPSSPWWMTGS